jgi:exonuclease III
MKYRRKSRKIKRKGQRGRGIIDGIRSKTTVKDREIEYIKKCPDDFVMCDQDEVNSSLCVPTDQPELCSDPNYTFRYVPPDEDDRDGLKPENRLIREENGKGPIQDPSRRVSQFNIVYDGTDEELRNMLEDDIYTQEETGRKKSYAPEFFPTSCTIQQKTEATINNIYEEGAPYKRRVNQVERALNFTEIPNPFKIITQNVLGLYRGKFGIPSEVGSENEAKFDLMRLRTAMFREFLRNTSPDFVCLQESTRTFIDLLDKQDIPDLYPYIYPTEDEMIIQENNSANATVTMLSKYPAKKVEVYMLQGNSSYYNALGIYEFDNLIVINVYMQAGSEISPGQKYRWENYARCRRQQLMFIKQKIDKIRASVAKAIVVLGDFNFELNSIKYKGEDEGRPERDNDGHLVYDPNSSNMKWAEHKFLVGDKGLNLNDSYKELHIIDPDEFTREGFTEYTKVNTFRFLGKLEEKLLRYDGIFFNNDLMPLNSVVINSEPVILDMEPDTVDLFMRNDIRDYQDNIQKYNTEYENYAIFNPKGNMEAIDKKNKFLSSYKTRKGHNLSIENGYELFVSDHFGVMTTFAFKGDHTGGRRRKSRRNRRRRIRRRSRKI